MFVENFDGHTSLGFELLIYKYLVCTNNGGKKPPTKQKRKKNQNKQNQTSL